MEKSVEPIEKRKLAMEWWNKLLYIEKFEALVKGKEKIIGYPNRDVSSLTGREIEMLYDLK